MHASGFSPFVLPPGLTVRLERFVQAEAAVPDFFSKAGFSYVGFPDERLYAFRYKTGEIDPPQMFYVISEVRGHFVSGQWMERADWCDFSTAFRRRYRKYRAKIQDQEV